MQSKDEDIHLLDYWRVLLKRRNIALTFFAVVAGLVAVYSFLATPVYQGTAQVLFELENNQTMTFGEGGAAYIQMKNPAEYYQTQKEILGSRAFADRVVRKMQLDKNPYYLEKKEKAKNSFPGVIIRKVKEAVISLFPAKKTSDPFPGVALLQEVDPALTDIVLNEIDVELGKANNIMKIHYNSENPTVAAVMATGTASSYIEHNLDIRVKPFKDAVEWLSARVTESKSKVEETEKELQQYREGKGIVSFETKENVITQKLQELVSQLVQTEGKRQEAEIKYRQIQSVIDRSELLTTVPDIMNNLVIQGLRNDELTIKKQLSDLSDKYGAKHPQIVKANSQLEMVQKNIIAEARKMLNAAKTDYEIALSRETSLRRTIDGQKQEVFDLSRKAIDFNVIAGESGSNKQFYELLLKKLQEASLSSGINISNAQIVDSAVIPKSPVKPNRGLNMLLATMAGLLGGIFAAFFVEYMDDSIKTTEDVDKALGLPFLGLIPSEKGKGPLYISSDSKSIIAEAYRTVRTGIILSAAGEPPRVLLVTSTVPEEGKTTTSANLAIAMAQMGEKVLVIDGDMRRHNLHEVFNLDNTIGISDIIVGRETLASAVKYIEGMPNMNVITGGTLAPNPSELLGSNRMKELLAAMREKYDRVIIDSPPLMACSDSLVLSKLSDGVIIVIWGGVTSRGIIKKAGQSLLGVNAKILGVVLNKIVITKRNSYYYPHYNYSNYYSGERDRKKKKKKA
ncbi:MAG: polysaccharide biosynthesis tyrosine autokinase [Nitrospirae bacterium]|nr:polysaccharide biosynthesis tyrosine autokinase [Nitrospirota bacterium]